MRILHLSDLHLTGQFKTFEEVWSGPSPHLKPGSFDFIVLSGDLSQRGAPGEYAMLSTFLERSILPLLVTPERQRLVLVPGNHDVDWGADIGTALLLGQELDRDPHFASRLQQSRFEPENSDLRVSISKSGHLDVLRLDPKRYPLRFQHVQTFFDTFYAGVPRSEHFRAFQLTGDAAEHWSAHVFPQAGIAFYGFNSCHQNDRYWTGAMFSAKAVEQARSHAEQHARDCIRIAVWHHGLDSGRGRPDHLSSQDIGLLYNAGFRIGFHGHTHRSAYETFDTLFGNRFFIVSTGSLGAGSEERPDAIGNQFSVAQVYPGHVDVEVFTRHGASTTYERNRERRRFLLKGAYTPRLDQLSHAASHQRTWRVEANGIARVEVELQGVTLRGELTLALVEPPYSRVLAPEFVDTSSGRLAVERKELPGDRVRFTVVAGPGAATEPLEWLRWSYLVSNCLSLNCYDLQARREQPSWLEHLPAGFDGRPYTVRFPCDELTLNIHLPEGVALMPGAVHAIALQRTDERGLERWLPVPSESKRCRARTGPLPLQVQCTVVSPLVDHRYVVAYAPANPGQPQPPDVSGLLEWLLEQCRDQPPGSDSLAAVLTRTLQEELKSVLGSPLGRESSWQGYLWHPSRQSLLTAFGVFPNRAWAVRFDWGSGVAGHALRHAQDASWLRGDASHQSLIFRPNPKSSPEGDYSWLVCIPILASLGGPAVGVVGFAGNPRGGTAEAQLREYAQDAVRGDAPRDPGLIELRNRLFTAVNSTFWQTLRSWAALTPRRKQLVQQICEALKIPPPPA
jgi:hypothetical protein